MYEDGAAGVVRQPGAPVVMPATPWRTVLIDQAAISELGIGPMPDSFFRRLSELFLVVSNWHVFPDVMPALIAALRKDGNSVRAAAAEVIGRFRTVFPLAGAALARVDARLAESPSANRPSRSRPRHSRSSSLSWPRSRYV